MRHASFLFALLPLIGLLSGCTGDNGSSPPGGPAGSSWADAGDDANGGKGGAGGAERGPDAGLASDAQTPSDASVPEAGAVDSRVTPDAPADVAPGPDGGLPGLACSDAVPCRMPPPDLSAAVDLETFRVPDEPALDRLVPAAPQASGHITVPSDPFQARLPACRFPVRMGAAATLTPTIDGSLSDWKGVAPVVIDREGDLPTEDADYDFLRMYYASDSASHYFAFVFKNEVPDARPMIFELQFAHVELPETDADWAVFNPTRLFALSGDKLVDVQSDGSTTPVATPSHFDAASQGSVLEVQIAREEIEGVLGQGIWTVTPIVYDGPRYQTAFDFAGAYWGGITADYGCLVPLLGHRSKLFVFRRADGVDAQVAEVIYRSVVASAPWAEREANDTFDFTDTVDVTVVKDMAMEGLHVGTNGILVSVQGSDNAVSHQGFAGRFQVTAHEYAHGFNADEYQLPKTWMKEAHSEWVGNRAISDAIGSASGQYLRFLRAKAFLDEETPANATSLDLDPWPAGGKSTSFFYGKATMFRELLAGVVPEDVHLRVLQKAKLDGQPYADSASLLSALDSQPQFTATVTGNMWNGWITGTTYSGSVFALADTRADSDSDGLFDAQEKELGLAADNADTDDDGVSDAFELDMGTDPKTPEPLHALVIDGLLKDWDKLAPNLLSSVATSKSNAAACSGAPSLKRAGVVFDGDWFAAGVELAARPADPTFTVEVLFASSSGQYWQFIEGGDVPAIAGFVGSSDRLRPALATAPITGTQAELYYNRAWFGWDSIPADVQVYVATFVRPSATTTAQCEITSALNVSRNVP